MSVSERRMPRQRRWGKDAAWAALAIVVCIAAVMLLQRVRHQWSPARTAQYLEVHWGARRVVCTSNMHGRKDLSSWDYRCTLWPIADVPPEVIGVNVNDAGITDTTSP